MKQAVILKSAEVGKVSEEQLTKINQFSRRTLTEDEVYVFSLVLCDNEIDRDFERFPIASLEKLAELFVGKTGIFDHNPKGENQTSRIFETALEQDSGREMPNGEPYCALRAWAYMMRCDKNADLILEIDAGIKKEVSVGCAVERAECSICGADARKKPCKHEVGQKYGGELCWRELCNPTDAYEWSFVAVPAQKQAGVTKGWGILTEGDALCKMLESGGGVTLSKAQAQGIAEQLRALEQLAQSGRVRMDELRRKMVAGAAFALPQIEAELIGEIAHMLNESQLEQFCKGFAESVPPALQLGGTQAEKAPDHRAFLI